MSTFTFEILVGLAIVGAGLWLVLKKKKISDPVSDPLQKSVDEVLNGRPYEDLSDSELELICKIRNIDVPPGTNRKDLLVLAKENLDISF